MQDYATQEWAKEIADVLMPLVVRLQENIQRVRHLVTISDGLYGEGRQEEVFSGDLLRAAVVFLHATLEDMLRTLAKLYLPLGDEAALNKVPLPGSFHQRADKFFLGKLANHRGKTVDDLLRESVNEYIGRVSYSNVAEVVNLCESLGLPLSEESKQAFPALDSLMRRRHQIVHQADRQPVPGQSEESTRPIGRGTVEEWLNAVRALIVDVMEFVIDTELRGKLRQHLALDEAEVDSAMRELRSRGDSAEK